MKNEDLQKMFFNESYGQMTVNELYGDRMVFRNEYVEWLEELVIKNENRKNIKRSRIDKIFDSKES